MTLGRRGGTAILLIPGLVSALLHPGCGGSVTGPDEGKRDVIDERQWNLDPQNFLAVDLDLIGFGDGTVDATVDWTLASDNVNLYVTAQVCTPEMFDAQRCAFKARADSATAKPERVSFGGAGGDRYRFWIVNFGPQRESGTFVAGLTPG